MKKYLSVRLLSYVIAFSVLIGGFALHANAYVVEQERPDFYTLNFQRTYAQWSFIDRVHAITDFEELLHEYVEFSWKMSQLCQCYGCGPDNLLEVYTTIRPVFSQQHATRQAYIDDFDYLVQALGVEYYIADKVAATRWLIENFFYMNDLIFTEFLAEGIINPAAEVLGFAHIGALPFYAMIGWDLSGYGDGEEILHSMLEAMEVRPIPYDFALPKTGFVVITLE
ncbi:MAG: hypothetical protein FWE21_07475 [Defluviitaleaceae bacterium]|nr:hypothetical protein [Defluviitaleaceae bacterium]